MFRRTKIITLFVWSVSVPGFAQDVETDLKLIAERVESAVSVAIDAEVGVYTSKGGTSVYSTKASMYKQGVNSRNVIDGFTYLQTEKYYVQVDRDEQAMMVVERTRTDQMVLDKMPDMDVKKLQKLLKDEHKGKAPEVRLVSNNAGIRKYSMTGIVGFKEAIIELDSDKGILLSVSYAYDNDNYSGQYVTVIYSKFIYDSDLSTYFNTDKYFTIKNGKVIPVAKYGNYKIYTEL